MRVLELHYINHGFKLGVLISGPECEEYDKSGKCANLKCIWIWSAILKPEKTIQQPTDAMRIPLHYESPIWAFPKDNAFYNLYQRRNIFDWKKSTLYWNCRLEG